MTNLKKKVKLYGSILLDITLSSQGVYVLGYPKSGTNWLCNILSDSLEIPFYKQWATKRFSTSKHIYHIHRFLPFDKVRNRTFYMMRDGRDVIISRYYAMTNLPDQVVEKNDFAKYLGKTPLPEEIQENMIPWIDYLATNTRSSIDWGRHVRRGLNGFENIVKYEDLVDDNVNSLKESIDRVSGKFCDEQHLKNVLDNHSFDRIKKNSQSSYAQKFLRSGKKGEWKKVFNKLASERFRDYAGDVLIEAGYETSHKWTNLNSQ